MKRTEALQELRRNAESLRGMGATALYLFGSAARDEALPYSDLDLFIDYDETCRFSLVHLVAMKQFLEEATGVDVDITTRDSLHPMLKADIEQTAIRVF